MSILSRNSVCFETEVPCECWGSTLITNGQIHNFIGWMRIVHVLQFIHINHLNVYTLHLYLSRCYVLQWLWGSLYEDCWNVRSEIIWPLLGNSYFDGSRMCTLKFQSLFIAASLFWSDWTTCKVKIGKAETISWLLYSRQVWLQQPRDKEWRGD